MDAGMVFMLIFAAIAVGLFLVFGSGAIGNLFCFGGDAKLLKTLEDIEGMAKKIDTYGKASSDTLRMGIAEGAKICFINPENPAGRTWAKQGWKDWEPSKGVVKMISERGEFYGSNVWYIGGCGNSIGKGKIVLNGKLIPQPQYAGDTGNFCVVSGKTLFFENKGLEVEVSS